MTKATRREHNQAMAFRMKAEKVCRKSCRCPICNRIVGIGIAYYVHVGLHK